MKFFFGAAIQGASDRRQRVHIYRLIIDSLKNAGCDVISEHTTGTNFDETGVLLEKSIGPLPQKGLERTVYIREKMIELVEGDVDAALFEASTPSLGTGIEIAHAYLRPRLGIKEIPVFVLYQQDYWPNDLSAMIKGITKEDMAHFQIFEYKNPEDIKSIIPKVLNSCK